MCFNVYTLIGIKTFAAPTLKHIFFSSAINIVLAYNVTNWKNDPNDVIRYIMILFNLFCFVFIFRLLSNEINYDEAFDFEYRGLVTMKGKAEPMNCWFLNRAKNDYSNIPHFQDLLG